MRFYDFMTLFWAAVVGAACGVFVYALAAGNPSAAWPLGIVATVGGAVLVYFWRMFKDPG